MDQQQLVELLHQQGIDTLTLAPLLSVDQVTVYRLSCEGAAAVPLWQTLRGIVNNTGHWPILLGGDEDLEEYRDGLLDGLAQREETPAALVNAGLQLDAQAWIRARLAESGREPQRGPWPDDATPASDFTIPYDMRSWTPLPLLHLALVPTREGWQAPAFLHYGGWNACPTPEEHVCMMKHWAESYDADPFGMARDRVEMMVRRPPQDQAGAVKLALEQYAYCNDIVDQGTETLDALAAILQQGSAWYFWWD